MLCWSASFYPQPIHNYQRRSTAGLAIDFPMINILGFIYYTAYTAGFLFSPVVREQYAARHPSAETPSVRLNDFAFALHAVILSTTAYSQFWPWVWGFRVSRFQKASAPILALFWGTVVITLAMVAFVFAISPDWGRSPSSWAWIDIVSSRGSVMTSIN